ncbi:helix-turn-helix domain-containing protein [Streptomyces diastatochromogenes]|nr:helix-turn-helix domain-containing protein [Streptomyces diastatochromogenes]
MAVGTYGTGRVDGVRVAGGTPGTGDHACSGRTGCDTATPWAELAAEMRRIKGATELSYGKLAQRTHYSRSSWERFLNQKQLPTRVAVEEFAAAAGTDPGPCCSVWSAPSRTRRPPAPRPPATRSGRPPRAPDRPARVRPAGPRPALGLLAAGALVGGGLVTVLHRAARLRKGR